MKTHFLVTIVLGSLLMTGCSTTRPISAVAMGAGGAALANELSNGDPAITAAGAGTWAAWRCSGIDAGMMSTRFGSMRN